jgi:uncharacterized membrane protein YhaH (DUF805 family)
MIFEYIDSSGNLVPVRSRESASRLVQIGAITPSTMVRTLPNESWHPASEEAALAVHLRIDSTAQIKSVEVGAEIKQEAPSDTLHTAPNEPLPSQLSIEIQSPQTIENSSHEEKDARRSSLATVVNVQSSNSPASNHHSSIDQTDTQLPTTVRTAPSIDVESWTPPTTAPFSKSYPNGSHNSSQRSGISELFSFSGRIKRGYYWTVNVCLFVTGIAIAIVPDALAVLLWIVYIWVALATTVKRAHDRNHSAWYLILVFIPIVNLIAFVELGFFRGTQGTNNYGTPPL